jgi:type I restriction enzyme S subunit
MTDRTKKTLAPRLRFPEFMDASGWKEMPLAEVYNFKPTNTLSRDKLTYEAGTIRNIHYGDIHTRFQTRFDLKREYVPFVRHGSLDDFDDAAFCTEGDVVFADASEDLNDVGKSIELVALHGEKVLSGTHTILATRRASQLVVGFGGYLFRSERMRQQIRREAQGSKVYQPVDEIAVA